MWNKMFVKASIEEKKTLFISIITWSYYGISHFQNIEIFENLIDARNWILQERTHGALTYS
jgi:hypothetical protein